MIKAALLLARIHLFRYIRILNLLGIFRVAFLSIILFLAMKATLKPGILQWQALAIVAIVLQAQMGRRDYVMLNNLGLNQPGYFILLYLIFLIPFIAIYLFWSDYIAALILISGIGIISLIRNPLRPSQKIRMPSFRFIPADSWEWRVGLRRYFWIVLIAYVIPAVFYKIDFLFSASILLIAISVNSFQLYHEPLVMIESLRLNHLSFLWRKIYLQCIFFTALVLPIVVAAGILYPEGFRPVMLIFLNSLVVQVFAVSLKYAGYFPGYSSSLQMSIISLLNFTFILPILLPFPVIMSLIFGLKAIKQLKLYTG